MTLRPTETRVETTLADRKQGVHVASTARLLPWVAGISLLAFAVGANLGKPTTLSAAFGAVAFSDTDLDGLSDVQEEVLGLSQDLADTDSDGWSDLEELTRGSNPKNQGSVPSKADVDVSVTAYTDGGVFHLIASVYLKGGIGSGHDFKLGLYSQGVAYMLPAAMYLPHAKVTVLPSRGATDAVYVLDVKIPQRLISAIGEMSFFALANSSGGSRSRESSSIDIVVQGGIPYEITPPPVLNSTTSSAGTGAWASATVSGGGFYTPLAPLGSLPMGSKQGKICVQSSRVVGSGGGGVQLEIVSANCESGDGVCSVSCSSTVGATHTGMDPLILVGG